MNISNWTDDKILYRLLNNKTDRNRWQYISVLRSRPSKELFFKCVNLAESINQKKRKLGIDILAQFGTSPRPFYKETVKLYFDLLEKEKNSKTLWTLLSAIGHNNHNLSKSQVDKLCSFSETSDNQIKEGLIFALQGIDKTNAIDTLIMLSSEQQSYLRDWATFSIGTQIDRDNKKIRNALWNRISDKHQDTKLEAILGLARRKDNRVIEIIRKELLDGECGPVLLEAIVESGDKQFLPLLRQKLKSLKLEKASSKWILDLKKSIINLRNGTTA